MCQSLWTLVVFIIILYQTYKATDWWWWAKRWRFQDDSLLCLMFVAGFCADVALFKRYFYKFDLADKSYQSKLFYDRVFGWMKRIHIRTNPFRFDLGSRKCLSAGLKRWPRRPTSDSLLCVLFYFQLFVVVILFRNKVSHIRPHWTSCCSLKFHHMMNV